jgi:hypothetical protein
LPVGSCEIEKPPEPSVVVWRVKPWPSEVTVTVAPPTGWPVVLCTRPEAVTLVKSCAAAGAATIIDPARPAPSIARAENAELARSRPRLKLADLITVIPCFGRAG